MLSILRKICAGLLIASSWACSNDHLRVVMIEEPPTPTCSIASTATLGQGQTLYSASTKDGFAVNWQAEGGLKVNTFTVDGKPVAENAVPHGTTMTDWSELVYGPDRGYTVSYEHAGYQWWLHELGSDGSVVNSTKVRGDFHEIDFTEQGYLTLFASEDHQQQIGTYTIGKLDGLVRTELAKLVFPGQKYTWGFGLVASATTVAFAASHSNYDGSVSIGLVRYENGRQSEVEIFRHPYDIAQVDIRVYPEHVFAKADGYAVYWSERVTSINGSTVFHLTYVGNDEKVTDHVLPHIYDLVAMGDKFVAPTVRMNKENKMVTMLLLLDQSGKELESFELDIEENEWRPTMTVAVQGTHVVVSYDNMVSGEARATFLTCK